MNPQQERWSISEQPSNSDGSNKDFRPQPPFQKHGNQWSRSSQQPEVKKFPQPTGAQLSHSNTSLMSQLGGHHNFTPGGAQRLPARGPQNQMLPHQSQGDVSRGSHYQADPGYWVTNQTSVRNQDTSMTHNQTQNFSYPGHGPAQGYVNQQSDKGQWHSGQPWNKPQHSSNQFAVGSQSSGGEYESHVGYYSGSNENYNSYQSYNPGATSESYTRNRHPASGQYDGHQMNYEQTHHTQERTLSHESVQHFPFHDQQYPQGQQLTAHSQIPLPILNEEKRSLPVGNVQSRPRGMMLPGADEAVEPSDDDDKTKLWLNSWLRSKEIKRRKVGKSTGTTGSNIKILTVRQQLKKCFGLLEELMKMRDSICSTDDAEEGEITWSEQQNKAKHLQHELEVAQSKLDEDSLKAVEDKLDARRKKRAWRKKRNAVLSEEYKEKLTRRQKLHEEIDAKLSAERQKIIDAKKEKEMKTAADKILAEVRKKLLDANKSLDLLKSLKKLRQIRKDSAVRKGLFTPSECDENFEGQISGLIEMMERQKKTYEDEEKTLQVILEMEQQETLEKEREQLKNREEQKIRKKQNRNMELIFGKEDVPGDMDPLRPFHDYYLQAQHSYPALVHIRREWDSFLVPDHVIGGSSIPEGWVVPPEPSDEAWASALKSNR